MGVLRLPDVQGLVRQTSEVQTEPSPSNSSSLTVAEQPSLTPSFKKNSEVLSQPSLTPRDKERARKKCQAILRRIIAENMMGERRGQGSVMRFRKSPTASPASVLPWQGSSSSVVVSEPLPSPSLPSAPQTKLSPLQALHEKNASAPAEVAESQGRHRRSEGQLLPRPPDKRRASLGSLASPRLTKRPFPYGRRSSTEPDTSQLDDSHPEIFTTISQPSLPSPVHASNPDFLAKKYGIPLSDVRSLIEEFQSMDEDGDGKLSLAEFEILVRKWCHLPPHEKLPKHLNCSSGAWASEGSGAVAQCLEWFHEHQWAEEMMVLDPQERALRQFCRQNRFALPDIETMRENFKKFDVDGSGSIDVKEFRQMLRQLDLWQNMTEGRAAQLFREVDIDGSGLINFFEFARWYMTLQAK
mmetsp:Transcript_107120/g.190325  ORF Transcript_107120/g.190325 Transcript_107120/m.190325 type:complete len:412 (-) Transcript_107120:134-1369(-)